jgi:hypothetical protein
MVSKIVLVVGREIVPECGETISKNCYISVNLRQAFIKASPHYGWKKDGQA